MIDTMHLRTIKRTSMTICALLAVVVALTNPATLDGRSNATAWSVGPPRADSSAAQTSQQPTIQTVAGGLGQGNATAISQAPYYAAIYNGNLYSTDFANNVVRKVNIATGQETVVAGNGISGYSGDGGPATQAELSYLGGIAIDSQGDIFIVDQQYSVIRMIAGPHTTSIPWDPSKSVTPGDIYTVAGIPYNPTTSQYNGTPCAARLDQVGDGCPATQAYLRGPVGIALDSAGDLFIADQENNLVRVVAGPNTTSLAIDPGQTMVPGDIYTVAGELSCSKPPPVPSNGTMATSACLNLPQGIAIDKNGDLFIGEDLSSAAPVYEVSATTQTDYGIPMSPGAIYTVAGGSSSNCSSAIDQVGDGCPATQVDLTDPAGVTIDPSNGALVVANYYNNVIQSISASTGNISLLAGIAPPAPQQPCSASAGLTGNGCPATEAPLNYPTDVLYGEGGSGADSLAGNLVIADAGTLRYVNSSGEMETIAGNGFSGLFGISGTVEALPFDAGAAGTSGDCGNSAPCGTPTQAEYDHPAGLAFGPNGSLYIANVNGQDVRMIASRNGRQYHLVSQSAGYGYLVAGAGTAGSSPNGAFSLTSQLDFPQDVAVDSSGNVFIADTAANTVEMIPKVGGTYFGISMHQGRIYTIAGGGSGTCSTATDKFGDGCPGTDSTLSSPGYITVMPNGNVLVSDSGDNLLREIDATTGIITIFAGNGSTGQGSTPVNGEVATQSPLGQPEGVAIDTYGDVFVSCQSTNTVMIIPDRTATIFGISMKSDYAYTIAGNGAQGFSGDGGIATSAELDAPSALATDPLGNVFIADSGNNRVREVFAGNDIIETIAGNGTQGFSGDGGPATQAALWQPQGLAIDALGNLFISDTGALPVTGSTSAQTGDNRIREVAGVADPVPPQRITAVAETNGTIYVAWSNVIGFEGALPQSFTINALTDGKVVSTTTVSGTTNHTVITGLNAGTTYTFTVNTVASGNTSPPSIPSASVSPSLSDPSASIQSITPASSALAGGEQVQIKGNGLSNATAVFFGAEPASGLTYQSSVLNVTVPPAVVASRVIVTVDIPGSTFSPTPSDGFVYVDTHLPYFPVTPYRILDTRCSLNPYPTGTTASYCSSLPSQNEQLSQPPANESINVTVGGTGSGADSVPLTAEAAVLNVTAITSSSTPAGYLTLYPAGTSSPLASNINYTGGEAVPNLVTVTLGKSGMVSVLSDSQGVNIVIDVEGYYMQAPSQRIKFTPLIPARILDTRCNTSPPAISQSTCTSESLPSQNSSTQPPAGESTISVQISGVESIPLTGVAAVAVNVTVADPATAGYLTIYPSGAQRPTASNINFQAAHSVANRVIVPVGHNGSIEIYNSASTSTQVIVDVNGYYSLGSYLPSTSSTSTQFTFTPSAPVRICDTRPYSISGVDDQCTGNTLNAGGSIQVMVAGVQGVALNASVLVANVTVTGTQGGGGYLTVYPDGSPQPSTSDINWIKGEVVPNLVLVKLGTGNYTGEIMVYASNMTNVIIDVVGWYS